ncbi:MAG: hypothetical protein GY851_35340 [bacterium]|nr:hypothetical protein [bacterium]
MSLISRLKAAIRRNVLLDGPGYRAEHTPDGSRMVPVSPPTKRTVDLPGGGAGKLTPIEITAKTDNDTYVCDVYANGTDTTKTATGATVRVLQIGAGQTIPTGTQFPAWEQPWSGSDEWTIDVARDYA